jgi:hypothetical protein
MLPLGVQEYASLVLVTYGSRWSMRMQCQWVATTSMFRAVPQQVDGGRADAYAGAEALRLRFFGAESLTLPDGSACLTCYGMSPGQFRRRSVMMRGLQLSESESPNNNVEISLAHRQSELDMPSLLLDVRCVDGMVDRNDDR